MPAINPVHSHTWVRFNELIWFYFPNSNKQPCHLNLSNSDQDKALLLFKLRIWSLHMLRTKPGNNKEISRLLTKNVQQQADERSYTENNEQRGKISKDKQREELKTGSDGLIKKTMDQTCNRLLYIHPFIHSLYHSSYWVNLESIPGDLGHKACQSITGHTHTHWFTWYRHVRDANQPSEHVFGMPPVSSLGHRKNIQAPYTQRRQESNPQVWGKCASH